MNSKFEHLEPIQLPLVNRFYKDCRYSAKANRSDEVYVLRHDRKIVAALRLSLKLEQHLFLRSMCVHPEYQRNGLGAALLKALGPVLAQQPVYCFPFTHLEGFYGNAGFERKSPESVASFIRDPWASYCRQGRDIIIMTRSPKAST